MSTAAVSGAQCGFFSTCGAAMGAPADPLQRIENTRSIVAVMQAGEILDRCEEEP